MTSPDQRREYQRLERPFVAKFRIHQEGDSKESHKWDIVTIRNLSAGGVSFNYIKKIPLDTVLEFDIGLSLNLGSVHCLGEICRIDESPADRTDLKKIPIYGIAARFTEMTDDEREAINKLVEQFHSNRA